MAANQHSQIKCLASAWPTKIRPVLDGQFNEPMWQSGQAMQLSRLENAQAAPTSSLRWCYDDEYLYIAIECDRDPSRTVIEPATTRTYDAVLDDLDHVHLVLDTDRDYNTAIELAVAENGQTYDRCCGISAFNPKWHVFVHPQAERWTAEIAISLSELTQVPALAGRAWCMSARRLIPGSEPHSWSQLRTHRPQLEANGILYFQPHE